jgi:ABC-2 type transport system permease protein
MHPFSGVRWWPALLLLAGAVAPSAVAYAVFERRDIGAGVMADRPGPERAGPGLRSGLGLAWRLQRGAVLGWAGGLWFFGAAYGAIGDDVGDLVGDSQTTRELFIRSSDIVDGFYGVAMLMLGLITAGFAIASALGPPAPHRGGRRPGRGAAGDRALPAPVAARARRGDGRRRPRGPGGGRARSGRWIRHGHRRRGGAGLSVPLLQYAAPVLALSGATRLLVGAAPRWATLAWLPLVLASVVMLFGEVFRLPQWFQVGPPSWPCSGRRCC